MGAITTTIHGALPDCEIAEVVNDWFSTRGYEIQPGSLELPIGERLVRVESDYGTVQVPSDMTIEDVLHAIPRTRKKEFTMSDKGHITDYHFTYFVRLDPRILIPEHFRLDASTKSSEGRIDSLVRAMRDENPIFDQIKGPYEGALWVQLSNQTNRTVLRPGDFLTQLRVICRSDVLVRGADLLREHHANPLLFYGDEPARLDESDTEEGLPLTLDAKGERYDGVIGFKGRLNPEPIDRRERGLDHRESLATFMAPETMEERKLANPGFYLLCSNERVRCPRHLAMSMTQYDPRGGALRLHKAGFFDPGFNGTAVLEVDTHETGPTSISHGQPAGLLRVQRLRKPAERVYGEANNNYQGQTGPRMPKQYAPVPYTILAQETDKMRVPIMAVPRDKLFENGKIADFSPDKAYVNLMLKYGEFKPRHQLEEDPEYKQVIPYNVFRAQETGRIFTYERTANAEVATERRLHRKISIGIGGHARSSDRNLGDVIEACRTREDNEEIQFHVDYSTLSPKFLGVIYTENRPVDTVHVGVLYLTEVPRENAIELKDPALTKGAWYALDEVLATRGTETWTAIAANAIKNYLTVGKAEASLR